MPAKLDRQAINCGQADIESEQPELQSEQHSCDLPALMRAHTRTPGSISQHLTKKDNCLAGDLSTGAAGEAMSCLGDGLVRLSIKC